MVRPWLQVEYDRLTETPEHEIFNTIMNTIYEVFEWILKDRKQI